MKKLTKRQINAILKNETFSVADFNKAFGTNAVSKDMSSMLKAMVDVNDNILLPIGARIATADYYTSFTLSTNKAKIASYYQAKSNAARDRASIVRISGKSK